jgi:hypothetical protein
VGWDVCVGGGVGESVCLRSHQEVEGARILEQWKKSDAGGDLADDGLDFAHDILLTLVELLLWIMDALFVCFYVKIPPFKNLHWHRIKNPRNRILFTINEQELVCNLLGFEACNNQNEFLNASSVKPFCGTFINLGEGLGKRVSNYLITVKGLAGDIFEDQDHW